MDARLCRNTGIGDFIVLGRRVEAWNTAELGTYPNTYLGTSGNSSPYKHSHQVLLYGSEEMKIQGVDGDSHVSYGFRSEIDLLRYLDGGDLAEVRSTLLYRLTMGETKKEGAWNSIVPCRSKVPVPVPVRKAPASTSQCVACERRKYRARNLPTADHW